MPTRFALSSLLAALALALPAGIGATPATPASWPTARFVVDHPELAARPLGLGRRVASAIRGPAVHRYTFELRRGQFVALELEQWGSDLVASLFDPAGTLVELVDGNGAGAVEVVTHVAATTGTYALQVAGFDWTVKSAPYAVVARRRERAATTPAGQADQQMRSWYDRRAPGAAVLVVRNGQTLYRRAIGLADLADRRPITLTTAFDLASVSKQFTGYAVALLIHQGRLRADDDVRRYLPELPDYGRTITIRHLLEHTSGVRDWDGLFALTGRTIEDGIPLPEVVAMAARQRGLHFEPGAEQRYSNTGYVLLAAIVERLTHAPFDEWTAEHLFRPLGLDSCSFAAGSASAATARALSYRGRLPPREVSRARTVTVGSSSLECSAEDLARWLDNYRSGRLGGAEVLRLVNAPLANPGGALSDYAFGNWHGEKAGRAWFGHKGLAAGYRTYVRTYPDLGLSIVFLANDGDDSTYRRAEVLEDLFLGLAPQPVEVPDGEFTPPPPPPPVRAGEYDGDYESAEVGTTFRVVAGADGLTLVHAVHGSIPLVHQGGDEFRSDTWFLPALTFVRDGSHAVTGFRATLPDGAAIEFSRQRKQESPVVPDRLRR